MFVPLENEGGRRENRQVRMFFMVKINVSTTICHHGCRSRLPSMLFWPLVCLGELSVLFCFMLLFLFLRWVVFHMYMRGVCMLTQVHICDMAQHMCVEARGYCQVSLSVAPHYIWELRVSLELTSLSSLASQA